MHFQLHAFYSQQNLDQNYFFKLDVYCLHVAECIHSLPKKCVLLIIGISHLLLLLYNEGFFRGY